MTAPRKLLVALKDLLDATGGLPITILSGPFYDAFHQARVAIAEADGKTDRASNVSQPRPIVIEVRGGVVQDVRNVPLGFAYWIVDHDDREESEVPTEPVPSPLPPDPEGMNEARALWAAQAIRTFQDATGTDDEDALSDLLVDLMHWADRNNYDFEAAFLRAHGHYAAETFGDER